MLRLSSLFCVVALAAVVYGYGPKKGGPETPDINTIKHNIIRREALLAVDALRKVSIKTPQCKLQIASIATDFVTAINYGLYSLDNIIPNLVGDAHKENGEVIKKLSSFVNDIQQCLPGDAEQLRQKLIAILEELNSSIGLHEAASTHPSYDKFPHDELQRKHGFVIYSVYKLKYQALLFDKSNKDLEHDIKSSLGRLTDALNGLRGKEDSIEYELRHALQHLSILTERCTYKIQNWIDANPSKTNEIKLLEDVSSTLCELYQKENLAIRKDRTAERIKNDLLDIYGSFTRAAIKTASVHYPENTGGQEFLRSCIFDAVTVGNAYCDNIKSIV